MAPKAIRHSDEEWLSLKTEIRELFIERDLTLPAVIQHLESQGFSASKSQLEYKLKAWGFKKKLPKNSSHVGWQYIRYHVEKRKIQGKKSDVILAGVRLEPQTVEREITRHHSSAWSSNFQIETRPRTPEGFPVSIRTPPSLTMEHKGHNSLPMNQFQQKIALTVPAPLHYMRNVCVTSSRPAPLQLAESGSVQSNTNVPALASTTGSIIPESDEGENFDRAKMLGTETSNEATQECINTTITQLLNDLGTGLTWQRRLETLETSGIMSSRVRLNRQSDNSRTLFALAEVLYQDAFRFLYDSRTHQAPGHSQSRSVKLITWLLNLGHNSDTYVSLPLPPVKATGLQIALFCENYELASVLLDSRANPNRTGFCTLPWRDDDVVLLPPLFIAILRTDSPISLRYTMIRRLLAAGADVQGKHKPKHEFLAMASMLSTLASIVEEETELKEMMKAFQVDLPTSVTADVLIAAAWNGKIRNLDLLLQINPDVNMTNSMGLTALHAAAHQGHTEICEMLLEKGSFVDYPYQGAPSPLHLAASKDHVDIVQMLHQHGASLLRGVEIDQHNVQEVCLRYFRHFYENTNIPYYFLRHHALLGCPIGAAVCAASLGGDTTSSYLVGNGVSLPHIAVYVAASRRLPHLLSFALRQDLSPDIIGPDSCTPLEKALMNVEETEKSTCEHIASDLLDAGARIRGGEAILALRNLGSWDLVVKILLSDHDGVAQRLGKHVQIQDWPMGITLLETAILVGSESLIEHVFLLKPDEYSAGALCAACYQGAREESSFNTKAVLDRLLQNRAKVSTRHKEDGFCETTAVGIAAWGGSSAILEVLHAHIPVADLAYFPPHYMNDDTATCHKLTCTVTGPLRNPLNRSLGFWHQALLDDSFGDGLLSSPVNFALNKPKILNQLLRYGYKFDRISLVVMADSGDTSTMGLFVPGRGILENAFASKFHSPLFHAINRGNMEMSNLLLHLGEDINDNEYELSWGRSPLACAVERDHKSLIDMLLIAGADVNAPPSFRNGRTALQCAAERGLLDIAKQLIDLGADINADRAKEGGRSALEAAADRGSVNMVQHLLSEGVETIGNGREQYVAAVAWAQLRGHHAVESILKEHRTWTIEDQILWERDDLLNFGGLTWRDMIMRSLS